MKYKLKIKEYRIENNITQKQLANKIGISQSYLSELENNKFDIKLSILLKMCDELDTSVENLIAYKYKKKRK